MSLEAAGDKAGRTETGPLWDSEQQSCDWMDDKLPAGQSMTDIHSETAGQRKPTATALTFRAVGLAPRE